MSRLHLTNYLILLPRRDVTTSASRLPALLMSHARFLAAVRPQDAVFLLSFQVLRPVLSVVEHPFPVDTPSGLVSMFLMSQALTFSGRILDL